MQLPYPIKPNTYSQVSMMFRGIIWLVLQLTAFILCQTYVNGAAPSSYHTWLLIHICVHVWGFSPPCTNQNIRPTWHWPLKALSVNEIWFTVRIFLDHLTVFNRTACFFWTQTSWHNPSTYDSTRTIRRPTKALLSKYQHIPTAMTLKYLHLPFSQ